MVKELFCQTSNVYSEYHILMLQLYMLFPLNKSKIIWGLITDYNNIISHTFLKQDTGHYYSSFPFYAEWVMALLMKRAVTDWLCFGVS